MGPARSWLRASLAALGILLVLAVLPVAAEASSGSDFVARINAARAAGGERSLAVRADLSAAAQAQAERMADRSELFHNPNLAGSVSHWSMLAENVGYGPDVATIHQAFMGSAPHRKNILNGAYTEVGVGVVFRDHVMWVAEVFRKPTGSVSSGSSQSNASKPKGSAAGSSPAPGSGSDARSTAQPHRSDPAPRKHRTKAPAHRAVHQAAPPRPAARPVAVAAAAEAGLPGVSVSWTAPPDRPLRDEALPTFAILSTLALALAGAAIRIRLL